MRILCLALVVAGCSPAAIAQKLGGQAVTPAIAASYCGSMEAYEAERASAVAAHRAGTLPERPSVGMSACTVLAMFGRPDDETTVDAGSGTARVWGWWIPAGPSARYRSVTLEAGPHGRGVVAAVVW